jgi:hypothetical protein
VFHHSGRRELFECISRPVPNQAHAIEGKDHLTVD